MIPLLPWIAGTLVRGPRPSPCAPPVGRVPRPPLVLLVAALLLGAVGCSEPASLAFRLNEEGNAAYYAGRYGEALEHYRQAQVLRPDYPELNLNAGSALHRQGDFERALRELQRALSADDARLRARAHFTLGNTFYHMGRLPEAIEAYKWALRLDPTDQDAKHNLEYVLRQSSATPQQAPQPGEGESAQPGQEGPQGQEGQGGQPQGGADGSGTPQGTPEGQSDSLSRTLQDAGADLSIEEAIRILDALRERERAIQAQLGRGPGRVPPGDRDW